MSSEPPSKVDSVVQAVLDKFIARSTIGRAKYGTDLDATARRAVPTSAMKSLMDRQDLTPLEWIQHAQEEHMEATAF